MGDKLLYLGASALALFALGFSAAAVVFDVRARRKTMRRLREQHHWPRPMVQLVEDPPALETPKIIGRIGRST